MTDAFDLKPYLVDLKGKQFVTYPGLLAKAHHEGLAGIKTTLVQIPTSDNGGVAIVHATVTMKSGATFDGIGDASAGSVNKMIVQHLIRMAETRSKGRALRDATNIGMTAIEELGDDPDTEQTPRPQQRHDEPRQLRPTQDAKTAPQNGDSLQLIRQTLGELAHATGTPPMPLLERCFNELFINLTPGEMAKTSNEQRANIAIWLDEQLQKAQMAGVSQ